MSGRLTLAYRLEYTDVPGGSAVRHDNNDLVVACRIDGEAPDALRARLGRWEGYWRRVTGRPVRARRLDGVGDPAR
jgi:hypothetical protein